MEIETDTIDDGGLVLRFQDNDNYYLLAIRDDDSFPPRGEENLKIYRRDAGAFPTLWSADIVWPRGVRHVIRFMAEGNLLSVFVDGELVGSVVDEAPLPAGGFGLRHYGESSEWLSRYDSFRWQAF